MAQDHTLFEILGHTDIRIWKEKADWIESNGGLILIDVHPDYMVSEERLHLYEMLLRFMSKKRALWHALPREVASWWKGREASTLQEKDGKYAIHGPVAGRGSVQVWTNESEMLKEHTLV